MRTLIGHKVNPVNDRIEVVVFDEPGPGGANHGYRLEWPDRASLTGKDLCVIQFQNGPIAEVGVNGVTHEALLEILIDRLECFQKGEYACKENDVALHYLEAARDALHTRTKSRMERGVEGTSKP